MNTTDPVDLEAMRGFTQGPWGDSEKVVICRGLTFIAHAHFETKEGEANASLIAAAPSMHAELTARRARDAEVAVLIASELARIDGYDPEDQHGGLYDLRWSGGPNPEPEGDAWHMDYLPKGERIAAILAGAKP
jgi:hypothetical protein